MEKQVTIYSTPTCHFCHAAKDFFAENNVAFTDHDVSTDEQARNEVVQKSGQMGVPVIFISWTEGEETKEEMIIGFDEPKLRELLGL